jgi:hypothetical protein
MLHGFMSPMMQVRKLHLLQSLRASILGETNAKWGLNLASLMQFGSPDATAWQVPVLIR